jgi:hypothetical protein
MNPWETILEGIDVAIKVLGAVAVTCFFLAGVLTLVML